MTPDTSVAYIKKAIALAGAMQLADARYFYRSASKMLSSIYHRNPREWMDLYVELERIADERGL